MLEDAFRTRGDGAFLRGPELEDVAVVPVAVVHKVVKGLGVVVVSGVGFVVFVVVGVVEVVIVVVFFF